MKRKMFLLIIILFFGCQTQEYNKYLQKPISKENAFDYYSKALDYFHNSNLDSASIFLNKAINLNKGYAPFYYLKGKINLINNQKQAALKDFENALLIKSFYPEVWIDISDLYYSMKLYKKALFYYEKCANYFPQKEQFNFYQAKCKNLLGQYEVAAIQLENFLDKKLYFSGLYYQLAYSYWKQNKIEKSVEYYNKFLKTDNGNFQVDDLLNGITIFKIEGNTEKVLSIANLGLKHFPNNPQWRFFRVEYFKKNNKQALEHEIKELDKISIKNDEAAHFLAKYYLAENKTNKAIKYYHQIENFAILGITELEQLVNWTIEDKEKEKYLLVLYKKTNNKKYEKQIKTLRTKE